MLADPRRVQSLDMLNGEQKETVNDDET